MSLSTSVPVFWGLRGHLRELKTKEKFSWVIPKVVMATEESSEESFSLQSVSHSSKGGFTKVVVTRAGCLQEGSEGEL